MSLHELHAFENYRSLYHQVQFLNQLLKQHHQKSQITIHNHILNRVKQILQLKDQNHRRTQEILTLLVIQTLEEILRIEKTDVRHLFASLKVLVEYLAHLNEFIGASAEKVLLGEVVIDVAAMNEQIQVQTTKTRELAQHHAAFFAENAELQAVINETTSNINASVATLGDIVDLMRAKQYREQLKQQALSFNLKLQQRLEQEILF